MGVATPSAAASGAAAAGEEALKGSAGEGKSSTLLGRELVRIGAKMGGSLAWREPGREPRGRRFRRRPRAR